MGMNPKTFPAALADALQPHEVQFFEELGRLEPTKQDEFLEFHSKLQQLTPADQEDVVGLIIALAGGEAPEDVAKRHPGFAKAWEKVVADRQENGKGASND
jgi:hypothetical protein